MEIKKNMGITGIVALVVLLFFYSILGISAVLSALAIILFFVVPIYLILNNFEIESDEKIIFSFLIGVGIVPSITYWLGMLISFRLAALLAFLSLAAVGITLRFVNRSRPSQSS